MSPDCIPPAHILGRWDGSLIVRLQESLVNYEGLLRECLRDKICDLADVMLSFEVFLARDEDKGSRVLSRKAYFSVPPIIEVDDLLHIINIFKKYINLGNFSCRDNEIELYFNDNNILNIINFIANKILEESEFNVFLTLHGILGDNNIVWDLGVGLCCEIDYEDSLDDILSSAVILSSKLESLLQLRPAVLRESFILSINNKKYVCSNIIVSICQ